MRNHGWIRVDPRDVSRGPMETLTSSTLKLPYALRSGVPPFEEWVENVCHESPHPTIKKIQMIDLTRLN